MYHSYLIIYNARLTTAFSKADRREVENLLAHIFLDTDAFERGGIKFTQIKGIEVWLYLINHLNLSDRYECRIAAARQNLINLFYNNDITQR